jgi:TolB-like protein
VLVERLGAGGVGEVWKARDKVLNRVVALKFLAGPREGSSTLQDLLREARAASALNHPNIVTIFEVGEREGATYLAMEFVEGDTLRDRLQRGRLPLHEAVDIASQIIGALASAHAHGIIHRDLKPENIMLRVDGYVKIVDFGLAKDLAFDQATTGPAIAQSASGHLAGTFTYMSPEQARSRPLTPASDVFSLGIVMYELLAGENPFRRDTMLDTLNAIVSYDPPSLQQAVPSTPPGLTDVVGKALRKDPTARYPSAVELRDPITSVRALTGVANVIDAKAARSSTSLPRPILAAVALLVVLALAGWGAWFVTRARTAGVDVGPVGSVAIMTFTTDADDAGAAAVAQGLPEDLGGALASAGFRVASRSSVIEMGAGASARAGAMLGVDALVEGSVRTVGGHYRIHVELVGAKSRFQIWSGTFTSAGDAILSGDATTVKEIAGQMRAQAGAR